MSVGDGVIHARSSKQHINTKSSTESELVGNSNYLTYPIWIIRFLEEQGCYMVEKRLHQDNESTIKLLKNGAKSCGEQSRHVDIWYFWTTDRIKEMDIEVFHCATKKMLGDFFTKPLQGTLFRNMRNVVQGLKDREILEVSNKGINGKVSQKTETSKHTALESKDGNESSYRQERVEELNPRKEKRVRFYGCVDTIETGKYANEKKNATYADIVKNKQIKRYEVH